MSFCFALAVPLNQNPSMPPSSDSIVCFQPLSLTALGLLLLRDPTRNVTGSLSALFFW